MSQVLYISYDGALEPLGESQVVGYLDRLAAGHGITLLSFEKPEDLADRARVSAMEERLAARGIAWVRLRYHKWPPVASTALDILNGIVRARSTCRRQGVQIVHARGYVPSLIAVLARRISRARFLFDMRGFWVDEKVEAGHWASGGVLYRVGKWCEQLFFGSADAIVSLTEAGVRSFSVLGCEVRKGVPVVVIPTCVDLERFARRPRDSVLAQELGLTDALVIGCVGTMSGWYMRSEMLRFLAHLSRSLERVQILIVTREDHDGLRRDCEAAGIPRGQLVLSRARFADMPRMTSLFDAGVFFIRPSMSKRGSAATKLAEFLACGVPVIINDGVGDSGAIVARHRLGVVLPVPDEDAFELSVPQVKALLADPGLPERCRRTAAELFDIKQGAERYRQLYERLLSAPLDG